MYTAGSGAADESQFGLLCVTESFGWTTGSRGNKDERGARREIGRGKGKVGRVRETGWRGESWPTWANNGREMRARLKGPPPVP